ncbi:hypothetical protein D9601_17890 [Sphingomonas sp. MA1305]|uniref:hypothetical protein n=1 Tax=Sphingomonas sp. MA1305 TaxID=2479204 RepID=UPI001E3E356B|nr:hypothetical protein [Sphingomonas sp. MA1305]MBI0477223.1 hypothetical protein [Sphingomonas sp. MA1305]
MTMARHSRRLLGTSGAIILLDLAVMASPAAAQDRLTADASASLGIATNPFLEPGSTPVAIGPTLSLRPSWTSERPLTTLRVEGDARATFYNRGYGTNDSFGVQGYGSHKVSETTTLNAAVGYINAIVGTFGEARVPVGTALPIGADLPTLINDPALAGVGRRQKVYQGSGNIVSILSPRDQIEAGVAVSANRYGGNLQDFNYATPSVAYSRLLGEKFTVGASFAVSFSNYLRTTIGDATVYQPSLTVSRSVGERWTLNASLGAALINLDEGLGRNRTTTAFNGSANLCRRDTRWTACFNAARQTVPSAFQGVRTSTVVGTSLGYRVNEADDLAFVGSYSHASEPLQRDLIAVVRDTALDFVGANANFSHRFRRTLSGFVSAGYAKSFGDSIRRDANLTATAGVTYRFNGR